MKNMLHITSGDLAGDLLRQSGLPGEVFVWHDILYDGPRMAGWPDEENLVSRARFLEQATGGGLTQERILEALRNQYRRLTETADYKRIVLWFDACLFDQSMLVHILTCLDYQNVREVDLLCVDKFPGIEPFHGLGQLEAGQMASLFEKGRPVTDSQFRFAVLVDGAFAIRDADLLTEISRNTNAPLPWVPAAVRRWLQEQPDPVTGLERLEGLALDAIRAGCETPEEIIAAVAATDTPPQFWGDTTLWAKINALAERKPPLVRIEGPAKRLPQWEGMGDLGEFRIRSRSNLDD